MPDLAARQFGEAMRAWILNAQQQLINEKHERNHGIHEEENGQLRWTQGNFESIRDYHA